MHRHNRDDSSGWLRIRESLLVTAVIATLAAPRAAAQTAPAAQSVPGAERAPAAASDARFHLGPLAVTPSINVSQGVDTNVLNASQPSAAERDATGDIAPQLQFWLKAGSVGITGRSAMTATYFQHHRDQGSVGTSQDVTVDLALWRFRPYVRGEFFTTRNRPSLDVNVRARYATNTWIAGSDVRVSGRTTIALEAERRRTRFDNGETFLGTNLSTELNRTRDQTKASLRYDLTPLTTLEVGGEVARDVFDVSPLRNARSTRISSALNFKPFALFSGRAEVGYLRFDPTDAALENHQGLAASVDLSYVLRDATRLTVGVTRDIEYAFGADAPYYVLTGLAVHVTQRIGTRWFATGSVNRYQLSFKAVAVPTPQGGAAATATSADQGDTTRLFGGELTYALTRRARVGVRTEQTRRQSQMIGRSHSGVRTFMTLSVTM